jgi:hypothetical protein
MQNFLLQALVVFCNRLGEFAIESPCLQPHDFLRCKTTKRTVKKINNKEAMISYAISCWHYTGTNNLNIQSCPNRINWYQASEIGGPNPLPCKLLTTSTIVNPSIDVRAFLINFQYTSSFASRQMMSRPPSSLHCFS